MTTDTNLKVWEKEYSEKKLMRGDKPQKSFLKFLKFVKKEKKRKALLETDDYADNQTRVLDLGSGNGKNTVFLAEQGMEVFGLEFSKNAIRLAEDLKEEKRNEIDISGGSAEFFCKSIGGGFGFSDESFDMILDVTSSNSLNDKERRMYLQESYRVLKKDGYFFTRGLLKDGDKNAKILLKKFPTSEKNTYKMPEFNLTEKIFEKKELEIMYGEFFNILKFEKETHYTTYGNKKYKRNFWILYLNKK